MEHSEKSKKYYVDPDLDDDTLYSRNSFIQNCLQKHYSRFITSFPVRIGVLIFFLFLTIFAIAGST